MKFELGQVVATPACLSYCERHHVNLQDLIRRHHSGDWGDLERDDKQANEDALKHGARLLSSYRIGEDRVWLLTEAVGDDGERASTCCMLPSDY